MIYARLVHMMQMVEITSYFREYGMVEWGIYDIIQPLNTGIDDKQ